MKKTIFLTIFGVILLALMAMPASTAIEKATLINAAGTKVVVVVNSPNAQYYFGLGYVLMGAPCVAPKLGASPGPDIFQWVNLRAGFQHGGTVYATTSTAATYTLTTTELGKENYYLSWLPNVNTTLTTMATNTAAMRNMDIPLAGDTRAFWLYNASTTVASTITIAAGTGVDLQKNEDTANLATAGTSMTKLIFIRKADKDVMLILDQYDVGD